MCVCVCVCIVLNLIGVVGFFMILGLDYLLLY